MKVPCSRQKNGNMHFFKTSLQKKSSSFKVELFWLLFCSMANLGYIVKPKNSDILLSKELLLSGMFTPGQLSPLR